MRLAYTSDIFATKGVNMLDIKRKFLVSLLGLLALIFVIGAVIARLWRKSTRVFCAGSPGILP